MKKKSKGGGGANWMDTYGDMVTLLLCFFVLLYSMSTISEEKYKAIVLSFNPNAVETPTATPGGETVPALTPSRARVCWRWIRRRWTRRSTTFTRS